MVPRHSDQLRLRWHPLPSPRARPELQDLPQQEEHCQRRREGRINDPMSFHVNSTGGKKIGGSIGAFGR